MGPEQLSNLSKVTQQIEGRTRFRSQGADFGSHLFLCLLKVKVLAAQLCPTFCYPMDGNPPDSSVHGILQARILQWVAIPSFRGSFQLRDQT